MSKLGNYNSTVRNYPCLLDTNLNDVNYLHFKQHLTLRRTKRAFSTNPKKRQKLRSLKGGDHRSSTAPKRRVTVQLKPIKRNGPKEKVKTLREKRIIKTVIVEKKVKEVPKEVKSVLAKVEKDKYTLTVTQYLKELTGTACEQKQKLTMKLIEQSNQDDQVSSYLQRLQQQIIDEQKYRVIALIDNYNSKEEQKGIQVDDFLNQLGKKVLQDEGIEHTHGLKLIEQYEKGQK